MNKVIRIASASHAAFALTMIGLGILGLIKGDFTVIWQPVPKGMPAREILVYLCAIISLASGVGLLWQRVASLAARVLFAYLLLWLMLLRLLPIVLSRTLDGWYSACEVAVMVAGSWVLYVWLASDWDRHRLGFFAGDIGLRIARIFYGLPLIPFGVAHFLYLEMTAPLIPAWLPWHVFWAYFTGCTFILAGLAIVFGVYSRQAAALSALQMGLFLPLVWLPRVVAGTLSAFQWGEIVGTIALTTAAWVVADSYRVGPRFDPKTDSSQPAKD